MVKMTEGISFNKIGFKCVCLRVRVQMCACICVSGYIKDIVIAKYYILTFFINTFQLTIVIHTHTKMKKIIKRNFQMRKKTIQLAMNFNARMSQSDDSL